MCLILAILHLVFNFMVIIRPKPLKWLFWVPKEIIFWVMVILKWAINKIYLA